MNAITKLTGGDIAPIDELEALIAAEADQERNAYDAKPVKLHVAPGGIGLIVSNDKMLKYSALDAIVLVSQKARSYWPSKALGQPPICQSSDGITGYFNLSASDEQMDAAIHHKVVHPAVALMEQKKPAPELYNCAACPLSKWGSADKGKGQACKSLRRLVTAIPDRSLPVVFTLPPTSVDSWDEHCNKLREYEKSAYFAVRTRFEMIEGKSDDGNPYSMVKPIVIEKFDKAAIGTIIEFRRQFEVWVRGSAVDGDDYIEGEARDTGRRQLAASVADGVKEDIPF